MNVKKFGKVAIVMMLALIVLIGFVIKAAKTQIVEAQTVEEQTVQTATADKAESQELENSSEGQIKSAKAIAAGIAIAFAAAAGTIGMGLAIAKTSESIARQPESESGIRSSLILGLVFIETLVIYALIVAILIIFVL